MIVTVKIAPDGTAGVFSHYDPNLVTLVKTLPSGARSWDQEAKTWTIKAGIDGLVETLRDHGFTVAVDDLRVRETPPPRISSDNWADQLLSAVDPKLAANIHRHLTRALHPDASGDVELMQQLNRAFDVHVRRRNVRGA